MIKKINLLHLVAILALLIQISACSQAYYGTLEKVGIHKRDILVDRVEAAKGSQEAAKEQFQSALEEFSSVVEFDGGDLEELYERLNKELEKSQARADDVKHRIDKVEEVSKALFVEWKQELKEYSSESLRKKSELQLVDTKQRYNHLIMSMRRAEARIDPVLRPFKDQVLFLKHNLNAKAVASLRGELIQVESDTSRLIKELEASIAEADKFIQESEF